MYRVMAASMPRERLLQQQNGEGAQNGQSSMDGNGQQQNEGGAYGDQSDAARFNEQNGNQPQGGHNTIGHSQTHNQNNNNHTNNHTNNDADDGDDEDDRQDVEQSAPRSSARVMRNLVDGQSRDGQPREVQAQTPASGRSVGSG